LVPGAHAGHDPRRGRAALDLARALAGGAAPRVDPIGDREDWARALADGFAAEWPEWCARVGRDALEAIFEPGRDGALPVILVAHAGGRPLGTVALRPYFAEEPMPETPWVRQLYVFPAHRGRGVFPALERAVEAAARDRGFATLYAATNRIERLLERRGWRACRRALHEGEPMTWLARDLRR
jgi:GNAT superfamily N-acetyltransferase